MPNGSSPSFRRVAEEGVAPDSQSHRRYGPQHVFTSCGLIGVGGMVYQVWGGISFQGATSICIWAYDSEMSSSFYCQTILKEFFLPFRDERYHIQGSGCVLVQPISSGDQETAQFLEENMIDVEGWEEEGVPSPIETIWEEIRGHVAGEGVGGLDGLRQAICSFWATQMTENKCREVIRSCPLFEG